MVTMRNEHTQRGLKKKKRVECFSFFRDTHSPFSRSYNTRQACKFVFVREFQRESPRYTFTERKLAKQKKERTKLYGVKMKKNKKKKKKKNILYLRGQARMPDCRLFSDTLPVT